MEILGYFATVLMGIVLGSLGGGGSILIVPILVYLMQVPASLATGYSLFIVGFSALIGAYSYYKKNLIDLKLATLFALPSLIFVYLTRAYLMPAIPKKIEFLGTTFEKDISIMVLFAILMLFASAAMIKNKKIKPESDNKNQASQVLKVFLIILEGATIGVFTGILGAGGGFLIVPALVILLKMPMKIAVGSSLYIIALKSLIGFVGDLQNHIAINFYLLFSVLAATLIGMMLAGFIAQKMDDDKLQKLFGYFTLTMAVFIFTKELLL